jgi:hypothetical protein
MAICHAIKAHATTLLRLFWKEIVQPSQLRQGDAALSSLLSP